MTDADRSYLYDQLGLLGRFTGLINNYQLSLFEGKLFPLYEALLFLRKYCINVVHGYEFIFKKAFVSFSLHVHVTKIIELF